MATWNPTEIDLTKINDNNRYENGDGVSAESVDAAIEASAYAQEFAKALTNPPNLTDVANIGTPDVSFEDYGNYKRFKFSNLKGETGKSVKYVGFVYSYETDTETYYNTHTLLDDGTIVEGSTISIPKSIGVDQNAVHFTAQTLSTSQQEQARNNIDAAGTSGTYPNMSVGKATKSVESNNNLFYNGDFSLNTQGKSEYIENGSTYIEIVDGWEVGYGDSTTTVLSNGIKITRDTTNSNPTNLQTHNFPISAVKKTGKYTLTFSVNDISKIAQTFIFYIPSGGSATYIASTNKSVGNILIRTFEITETIATALQTSTSFTIGIQVKNTAEYLEVYYAKLEEGETSTAPNGLVQNATMALYSNKAEQDIDGNNIPDTYAKQNGEYPNMTVGGLSYSKFGATSTGEYTDCYVEICNVAFKTNWGNASIILLVNGYMPYTTQRSGIIEIDVRAASNVWTVKLAKVLSGNLEADRLSIYSDENNVIHVYLHVQKEVFAITKLSALYDGVNITYPNTIISTLPDGVISGNNFNIARYDSDGNIISDVYAKQNGTYSDMTVGNATKAYQDSQGNVLYLTYATKAELNNAIASAITTALNTAV